MASKGRARADLQEEGTYHPVLERGTGITKRKRGTGRQRTQRYKWEGDRGDVGRTVINLAWPVGGEAQVGES